eukprot:CAMPEP_0184187226 /NCGR_PEP_ID=MMETSP0976-20121227/823_1 /TAXON_ID=483370 /ORGANISM="non described non described, Strain CCMP2097" /LENGTH=231 /DNA_ID=CAMNT_0026491529 /DNA_START=220 /DNA_END=913 /DNA_ORIENTATION=-
MAPIKRPASGVPDADVAWLQHSECALAMPEALLRLQNEEARLFVGRGDCGVKLRAAAADRLWHRRQGDAEEGVAAAGRSRTRAGRRAQEGPAAPDARRHQQPREHRSDVYRARALGVRARRTPWREARERPARRGAQDEQHRGHVSILFDGPGHTPLIVCRSGAKAAQTAGAAALVPGLVPGPLASRVLRGIEAATVTADEGRARREHMERLCLQNECVQLVPAPPSASGA